VGAGVGAWVGSAVALGADGDDGGAVCCAAEPRLSSPEPHADQHRAEASKVRLTAASSLHRDMIIKRNTLINDWLISLRKLLAKPKGRL
jgi:hypothetical protein